MCVCMYVNFFAYVSLVKSNPLSPTLSLDRQRWRAKAISDYDAQGPGQLSLRANEVRKLLLKK